VSDSNASPVAEAIEADPKFRNYANDREVKDRALHLVREIIAWHQEVMEPLHERWRVTYWTLSGNTIDQAGPMRVHVPELYKMVETIEPRVVENLTQVDPWFRPRARREMNEQEVETMAAHLDFQIDQCRFKDRLPEAVRYLLITQAFAFRVDWKDVRRKIPNRIRENGKVRTVGEREHKVYVGPSIELLDPWDFIIDPRATDPQSAGWVGHRGFYTLAKLREMQFLDNLDEMEEYSRKHSNYQKDGIFYWLRSDEYKAARAPTERSVQNSDRFRHPQGSAPKFEVVHLCMPFDLLGDGVFEECMISIGAGTTVLRVSRNPYDYQQRPYATARAVRNGHNFYGVGVLDNAVRLNQHLDRYNAIFMRLAEGAACPMIFTDSVDSDLPDSMFHSRPFRVVKGAGRVTMQQVPAAALNAGPMVMGMMSRNIEETVGAFKIMMGQDSTGGTATEATLALQEGNRRLRGLIRNCADGMRQLLRLFTQFNSQFLMEEDVFPVVGKRSKLLAKKYLRAGPEHYLDEVDFEIVGLDSLHTYGLKATGLQQIMATSGPLLMQYVASGRVEGLQILHELFSTLIGPETADRIVKLRRNRGDRWSQEEENEKIRRGERVEVSPARVAYAR